MDEDSGGTRVTVLQPPPPRCWEAYRPPGGRLLVRLSEVPARTPAGIWLSDEGREQFCEGRVLSAGLGMRIPGMNGQRAVMQAGVGDRVLFQRKHLSLVEDQEKIATGDERDLLAVIDTGGGVWPCGSWILLERGEDVEQLPSGIYRPEKKRRRRDCGRVLRWGPGRMRLKGPLMGTRLSVPELWGLPRETDLTGMFVVFGRLAGVLDVFPRNGKVANWLISAENVLAYEIPDG